MGNRVSLKGRGADIFFGTPPDQPAIEEMLPVPPREEASTPAWLEPPRPASASPEGESDPAAYAPASSEAPKEAPLQAGKLASKQAHAFRLGENTLEDRLAAVFSCQGLKANTFRYTQEELDAIRDIVYRLETVYGKKIDKNDVVRVALNWLIFDFEEHQEESLLVRILTSK